MGCIVFHVFYSGWMRRYDHVQWFPLITFYIRLVVDVRLCWDYEEKGKSNHPMHPVFVRSVNGCIMPKQKASAPIVDTLSISRYIEHCRKFICRNVKSKLTQYVRHKILSWIPEVELVLSSKYLHLGVGYVHVVLNHYISLSASAVPILACAAHNYMCFFHT